MPYFGSILAFDYDEIHGIRLALDALTLFAAIALVVVGCMGKGGRLSISACAFGPALMVLGVALEAAVGNLPGIPVEVAYAGVALLAVGFALLTGIWVKMLQYVEHDVLLSLVLSAFVVSLLFGFADLVDGVAKALFNSAIPAASGVCAAAVWRKASCGQNGEDAHLAGEDSWHAYEGAVHIVVLVIVIVCAEIACCVILRGVWTRGGVGYANMSSSRFISY